ncbi:MAG: PASTA domain-containing protein [Acidobacteriota bacterium]
MRGSGLLRGLAAALGLGIGCAGAVWLVLWVSLRSSAVRVPSVQGLEPARAGLVLREVGLVVRTQDGVFDATVPPGRIARQRPAAGFQVKRGGTVLIYPSLGKASLRVADLAGVPVSLAEAELEEMGLAVGRRCDVEGQADAAMVLATSPSAGVLVPPGSEVALLVNRTPREKRYVMPDFVGVGEEDASRVLRALGFRLAAVQRLPYPGIGSGTVLRQDPPAGGPVVEGAMTALWVSQ